MSDLDTLLLIVEESALRAQKTDFVANLMVSGTDEYKAVESGIKIGSRVRREIMQTVSDEPKEGECGSGSCQCLA